MSADNIKKLRLYEDTFNSSSMTDENSLAAALLTQPDVLSPVITHLAGQEDKRFPLSYLTEGMGATKYINDIEYDYPVMGRMNKALECKAQSGTGANHTRIKLTFNERWFVRQYIIEAPDGTQLRIMDDPTPVASGYEYSCQLVAADGEGVNGSVFENKLFVQFYAPAAMSGTRGNESHWCAPSKMRNQISVIRNA